MSRWDTAAAAADAHATQSEDERAVARPVVDALVESGAMKLWVPTAYGGGQADLATGLDAIATLAKADGATGWVVMIANTTALLSASLSPEVAIALFGEPGAITGGFAAPVGSARATADGASVSGRWAWGSGSSHATTMGGGVRWVDDSGASVEGPGGSRVGFAFFADGVDLLDTWDASGMRASASTDYAVTDVQVPLDHIVAMDRRQLVVDDTLYRFSTFGALALGVAMVLVGLAERAIDELVSMGANVPQGSSRGLAERAPIQAELARARGLTRAARTLVHHDVALAWEQVEQHGRVADDRQVGLREAATTAAELARDAVDRCYHAAGGQAVYRTAPIQRVFRDAHVASQHAMVAARVLEPVGRHAFGLPTDLRGL